MKTNDHTSKKTLNYVQRQLRLPIRCNQNKIRPYQNYVVIKLFPFKVYGYLFIFKDKKASPYGKAVIYSHFYSSSES